MLFISNKGLGKNKTVVLNVFSNMIEAIDL